MTTLYCVMCSLPLHLCGSHTGNRCEGMPATMPPIDVPSLMRGAGYEEGVKEAEARIATLESDLAATRTLLAEALVVADGLRRDLDAARDCGPDSVCGTVGEQCQKCLRIMFLREVDRRDALAKFVRERFRVHRACGPERNVYGTVKEWPPEWPPCDCGFAEASKLLDGEVA